MNRNHWDIKKAMNIFYTSQIYQLMRNGISDMHCRSDLYLAKEIEDEKKS